MYALAVEGHETRVPEPARLVGVQIKVFFLQFGVLVVPFVSAWPEPGAVYGDDALGTAARAIITHEGEAERFTCFAESSHLAYGGIKFHTAKVLRGIREGKDRTEQLFGNRQK